MSFQDKTLLCRDCNNEFVWTAGEQEFFASKGFNNPPSRCVDCRKKFKEEKKQGTVTTTITCKDCGNKGDVPFKPINPDDILCADCFKKFIA